MGRKKLLFINICYTFSKPTLKNSCPLLLAWKDSLSFWLRYSTLLLFEAVFLILTSFFIATSFSFSLLCSRKHLSVKVSVTPGWRRRLHNIMQSFFLWPWVGLSCKIVGLSGLRIACTCICQDDHCWKFPFSCWVSAQCISLPTQF